MLGRRGHLRASALGATAVLMALPLAATPAVSDDGRELVLRFDGSDSRLDLTSSGTADVAVRVSSAGGEVDPAAGWRGASARTPQFSPDSPARPAVVVVKPRTGDPLSPGTRDFSFGAHFDLDSRSRGSTTDNGDNLIQRGLYANVQYKIQVDRRVVSCRVAGSSGAVSVRASTTVDPGDWYRAICTRTGGQVTLTLTKYAGSSPTTWRWSARGTIGALNYASTPLSVGGKVNAQGDVLATDSDQFNGRIDEAFFELL